MNEQELRILLNSDKSTNSIYTILGKKLNTNSLDWIKQKYSYLDISDKEKLYFYLNSLTEISNCICGKPLNFIGYTRGYSSTCSKKCNGIKIQRDFGKQIREKSVKTCIERYGVEYGFNTDSAKESTRKASKLRIGIPLSEEHKANMKSTNLMKFGFEYASQSPVVKEKTKDSFIKKYGNYYVGTQECTENRNKIHLQTKFDRLKNHNLLVNEEITMKANVYKAVCELCNFSFDIDTKRSSTMNCMKCFPKQKNRSVQEKEIFRFVSNLGFTCLTNVKSKNLIYPLTLDIWIPEIKTAIEFNGNYWHRESLKGTTYHVNKYKKCKEKEINLIQIFEYTDLDYSKLDKLLNGTYFDDLNSIEYVHDRRNGIFKNSSYRLVKELEPEFDWCLNKKHFKNPSVDDIKHVKCFDETISISDNLLKNKFYRVFDVGYEVYRKC